MWRLFRDVLAHMLLICLTITEDVEFLKELKKKQMREADFTADQIARFEEVDAHTLTNWKNSVIMSIVSKVPRSFRSMMPFNTWSEAMYFLREELKNLSGEE